MNKRLVSILWLVVAVLAGAVFGTRYFDSRKKQNPTELEQGDEVVNADDLSDLASVVIKGADSSVTLNKKEDKWVVAERGDYPLEFGSLMGLLRQFGDMKVAQSQKAGPKFDARFGMDLESSEAESHGYLVTMNDSAGNLLQEFQIGKETKAEGASATSGRYLRLKDESAALYVVNEAFTSLSSDPTEWLDSSFFNVTAIESIEMKGDDGWKVIRENVGADFELEGLAEGQEPETEVLSRFRNVLSRPSFNDVLSDEEGKAKRDAENAQNIVISTFEGFTYDIDFAPEKKDEPSPGTAGNLIVRFDVSADLPEKREAVEGESEEEAKAAEESFVKRNEELSEKLEHEKAFAGLYYEIPNYLFVDLDLKRDALAKAVETPEVGSSDSSANAGTAPAPAVPTPLQQAPSRRPRAVSRPIQIPPRPEPVEEPEAKESESSVETPPVPGKPEQGAPVTGNAPAKGASSEKATELKETVEEKPESGKTAIAPKVSEPIEVPKVVENPKEVQETAPAVTPEKTEETPNAEPLVKETTPEPEKVEERTSIPAEEATPAKVSEEAEVTPPTKPSSSEGKSTPHAPRPSEESGGAAQTKVKPPVPVVPQDTPSKAVTPAKEVTEESSEVVSDEILRIIEQARKENEEAAK